MLVQTQRTIAVIKALGHMRKQLHPTWSFQADYSESKFQRDRDAKNGDAAMVKQAILDAHMRLCRRVIIVLILIILSLISK